MKIKKESDIDKIVVKFLRHSKIDKPKCKKVVTQLKFRKTKFDVVGFSPEDGVFHIVESKMGTDPKAVGHAFGQILIYKSILSGNGYQFLGKFHERSGLNLDTFTKIFNEKKLRVCFYVAIRDEACKDYELIKLIKQSIPSVGIIWNY